MRWPCKARAEGISFQEDMVDVLEKMVPPKRGVGLPSESNNFGKTSES
jgi:hypothetical protein